MAMTARWEIFPDDLDATADFYVRVLGFEIVKDQRSADQPYLSVQREQVRIGAAARPAPSDRQHRRPPTGVELVLEVDDLSAERDRVLAHNWPLAEDVTDRPWGLPDFRVLDPRGYYLRITTRE